MLVGLQGQVEHLSSLIALLVNQLVADSQKSGEAGFDNLIKMLSIIGIGRLVTESAADGEQALQTSKNGAGAVGVEELESKVHKSGPSCREIILQDALKNGNQLLSNERLRGSQNGQKTVSNSRLLLLRDEARGFGRVSIGAVPRAVDSILDVDDG